MNKRQTYEQANKVFDKAVKLEQDFGEYFTGWFHCLFALGHWGIFVVLIWAVANDFFLYRFICQLFSVLIVWLLNSENSEKSSFSYFKIINWLTDTYQQMYLPFCVCVCSYCTGWLTRGDLQQNQANHWGAVWSLHLDPLLREALSSLPSPLHRCRAPLLPPRDPTQAQIAPLLTSFLQICFISSFSVIIMLLSKWKRSLITITVTVHTPAWVSQQIHSRLEMPFQRNLSNENKREKE